MTSLDIINRVKAAREAKGMRLEWTMADIARPGQTRNFTVYAKDEAEKQAWLASGEQRGWILVSCAS